jgi:hypothetical protein
MGEPAMATRRAHIQATPPARCRRRGRRHRASWPQAALAALVLAATVGLPPPPVEAETSPAAPAQTITTIAGGPGQGPATSVALRPEKVLLAGNRLYSSDDSNAVVRVLDLSSGIQTVVAGIGVDTFFVAAERIGDGGPATAANLDSPEGLALDPGGSLYIASRDCVRKVLPGPDGVVNGGAGEIISTVVGECGFRSPSGEPNSDGTFDLSPSAPSDGDGGPARSARLGPGRGHGLDFAGGALYISDDGSNRIRRVVPAGEDHLVAVQTPIGAPGHRRAHPVGGVGEHH